MDLTRYVNEKKLKIGTPNPAEARSLKEQAERRLEDLKQLPLTDANASFRFEQAYECAREMLQSLMAEKGYKPYSHEVIVEFSKSSLSAAEVNELDRMRVVRNDINYRGKIVNLNEAREAILFSEKIINKLKVKL